MFPQGQAFVTLTARWKVCIKRAYNRPLFPPPGGPVISEQTLSERMMMRRGRSHRKDWGEQAEIHITQGLLQQGCSGDSDTDLPCAAPPPNSMLPLEAGVINSINYHKRSTMAQLTAQFPSLTIRSEYHTLTQTHTYTHTHANTHIRQICHF